MTLTQFNQLKQATERTLNHKLELSRKLSQPYSCVTEQAYKTFKVYNDTTQAATLQEMLKFAVQVKGKISHSIEEESRGRIGYYSHTIYKVEYTQLCDIISQARIKRQVHKALINIMKLDKYSYIKCEIMQLFKDSKIDWDAVMTAHTTNCSL